ncbi:serine hydrolase [Aeoliella sp. SH292]|uniref:serine hydrolase n=1 Tax=Aeoliella sp. SH292 TaxID=3454464 RepID=UPI003F9C92A0
MSSTTNLRRNAVYLLAAFAAGVFSTTAAQAQSRPEAGLVVPQLTAFDDIMRQTMTQHDISAGVAAIMRDGKLLYRRAFGWDNSARTVPIDEDVTMRIASITKPLTAATIRNLIADGHISLNQRVFSLDEPGSGILDHSPFGNDFDPRLKDITVNHLLQHRGGWNRDQVGDWTYDEREIASDMSLPSPPGRDATLRWILGNDAGLQHNPGSTYSYSNIGFMVLGMIAEEVTGKPHLEVMREEVFRPVGIPDHMIKQGRTFAADQDPREPHYEAGIGLSVFGSGFVSNRAYGGWDHEARIGQGGIVADPIAILEYMQHYIISGGDIGLPVPTSGGSTRSHGGSLSGTSTVAVQRADGIDYVIFFNKSDTVGTADSEFNKLINAGTIQWPTTDIRTLEIDVPGDLTGDGAVDIADINAFLSSWRSDTSSVYISDRYFRGDMNFDGTVNLKDAWLLRNALRQAGSSLTFDIPTSIPEPASLRMVGLVLAGIISACRVSPRRSNT